MEVRASTYTWRQFYDDVHFYLCLTGIPVLILITAVNIRVGPATLTDIPEGYEPQQHEYYRHPITRFLVKYMIETPQSIYERSMYSIKVIKDEGEMEALYKKVFTMSLYPSHFIEHRIQSDDSRVITNESYSSAG